MLWHIFTIGLCNLFYSALIGSTGISVTGAIYFQGITLLIGILPVSILVILDQNRLLRKHINSARSMNANLQAPNHLSSENSGDSQTLVLTSETGKEKLRVIIDCLFILTLFINIGIWRWRSSGEAFYLVNFGYIGLAISTGIVLTSTLPRRLLQTV